MAREIYRSTNGEVWLLSRDADTGLRVIEHTPNEASGGKTSSISVGVFLNANHFGPEQKRLLELIGALADRPEVLREGLLDL